MGFHTGGYRSRRSSSKRRPLHHTIGTGLTSGSRPGRSSSRKKRCHALPLGARHAGSTMNASEEPVAGLAVARDSLRSWIRRIHSCRPDRRSPSKVGYGRWRDLMYCSISCSSITGCVRNCIFDAALPRTDAARSTVEGVRAVIGKHCLRLRARQVDNFTVRPQNSKPIPERSTRAARMPSCWCVSRLDNVAFRIPKRARKTARSLRNKRLPIYRASTRDDGRYTKVSK
jgi:hypothetical protein